MNEDGPNEPLEHPFRILSLSGGGARGIFQAIYLSILKAKLSFPLYEAFDLIAGTSTGAIVGLAAALPIDLDRIVDMYRTESKALFNAPFLKGFFKGARYDQGILRQKLLDLFGTKRLSDAKTHVLFTAASLQPFGYRMFTCSPSAASMDGERSAVEVALASAAAPTYFAPIKFVSLERSYVDGGMWASSPSLASVLYAHRELGIPFTSMRVVAISTGDFPKGVSFEHMSEVRPYSLEAMRTVYHLMSSSQESFADEYAEKLVGESRFIRISEHLDELISLDEAAKAVSKLPPLAEAQAEKTIEKVVRLINSKDGIFPRQPSTAKGGGQKLVRADLVEAAGLTSFFPSRAYYGTHRSKAANIAQYVDTATRTVVLVSIHLNTGVQLEGFQKILENKLNGETGKFQATISLLDPRRADLMSAMCSVFEMEAGQLATSIKHTLQTLGKFRSRLGASAQSRLDIRIHKSIPFGSAIIIDSEATSGKIQIETKAYKEPLNRSFGYEIVRTSDDGLYDSLLRGYSSLLQDGESIDPKNLT